MIHERRHEKNFKQPQQPHSKLAAEELRILQHVPFRCARMLLTGAAVVVARGGHVAVKTDLLFADKADIKKYFSRTNIPMFGQSYAHYPLGGLALGRGRRAYTGV